MPPIRKSAITRYLEKWKIEEDHNFQIHFEEREDDDLSDEDDDYSEEDD